MGWNVNFLGVACINCYCCSILCQLFNYALELNTYFYVTIKYFVAFFLLFHTLFIYSLSNQNKQLTLCYLHKQCCLLAHLPAKPFW